jgi:hypothetical protein
MQELVHTLYRRPKSAAGESAQQSVIVGSRNGLLPFLLVRLELVPALYRRPKSAAGMVCSPSCTEIGVMKHKRDLGAPVEAEPPPFAEAEPPPSYPNLAYGID